MLTQDRPKPAPGQAKSSITQPLTDSNK